MSFWVGFDKTLFSITMNAAFLDVVQVGGESDETRYI